MSRIRRLRCLRIGAPSMPDAARRRRADARVALYRAAWVVGRRAERRDEWMGVLRALYPATVVGLKRLFSVPARKNISFFALLR